MTHKLAAVVDPPVPEPVPAHDHHHDRQARSRWGRVWHGLSEALGMHGHAVEDQIDDALEANEAGRRALLLSLAGLLVTARFQAVVVLSGSVALLGDTLHNFVDALTAIPLLVAFALARCAPRLTSPSTRM